MTVMWLYVSAVSELKRQQQKRIKESFFEDDETVALKIA